MQWFDRDSISLSLNKFSVRPECRAEHDVSKDERKISTLNEKPLRNGFFSFNFVLVLIATLLTACSISPTTEQFYTLTTLPVAAPVKTARPDALQISLSAITLPEQVDRPQIVTLDGQQRVTISEQHRWAASLQAQIAQVLASSLAQSLDTPYITAYPQPETRTPNVRISLTVQRFDAVPGQEVIVEALWAVRNPGSEQVQNGHAMAHAPVAKGGDEYAAIAAAYRVALEQIGMQVADGVRSLVNSK